MSRLRVRCSRSLSKRRGLRAIPVVVLLVCLGTPLRAGSVFDAFVVAATFSAGLFSTNIASTGPSGAILQTGLGLIAGSVMEMGPPRRGDRATTRFVRDGAYRELPPDAEPISISIPSSSSKSGITASQKTFKELVAGLVAVLGETRRFGVGLRRLRTAVAEGDGEASSLQAEHLRRTVLPRLEIVVAEALAQIDAFAATAEEFRWSREEVLAYLARQRRDGFPAIEEPLFAQMSATVAERGLFELSLLEWKPEQVEYSLLDDAVPGFRNALELLVPLLREFDLGPTAGDLWEVSAPLPFRRGDVDNSGEASITDPLLVARYLFLDPADLPCLDAADANDDTVIDVSDVVSTLYYLFLGCEPLPFPTAHRCGLDPGPAETSLGCRLPTSCLE